MQTKEKRNKEIDYRKTHIEKTLKWFDESVSIMRKKHPDILDRIESFDRSQLVAECCRLFFTAKDYFRTIIYLEKRMKEK